MGGQTRYVVAAYDVRDPLRLQRVAKVMKDYGRRVLYSVFECVLDEDAFEEMKARVCKVMEDERDSVRYYLLCGRCLRGVEWSGRGEPFREDEYEVL